MKEINEQKRNKTPQKTQESKAAMHSEEPIDSVEEAYGIEDDEHYAG
ncbi:hypothetical protein ABLT31_33275 [Ammoniphilus sp. 3BR4]